MAGVSAASPLVENLLLHSTAFVLLSPIEPACHPPPCRQDSILLLEFTSVLYSEAPVGGARRSPTVGSPRRNSLLVAAGRRRL